MSKTVLFCSLVPSFILSCLSFLALNRFGDTVSWYYVISDAIYVSHGYSETEHCFPVIKLMILQPLGWQLLKMLCPDFCLLSFETVRIWIVGRGAGREALRATSPLSGKRAEDPTGLTLLVAPCSTQGLGKCLGGRNSPSIQLCYLEAIPTIAEVEVCLSA